MKRRLAATSMVLFAFLTAGCDGGVPFSFNAPPGWESRPFPGLKYNVVLGPPSEGFAPNINVVEESFGGSLQEYAQQNLITLRQMIPQLRVLKQEDFRTDEGLECVRLVTENMQEGRWLRQTAYLFGKGSRKFVVTCTALANGGERLDPVFEASMRTFRFIER